MFMCVSENVCFNVYVCDCVFCVFVCLCVCVISACVRTKEYKGRTDNNSPTGPNGLSV